MLLLGLPGGKSQGSVIKKAFGSGFGLQKVLRFLSGFLFYTLLSVFHVGHWAGLEVGRTGAGGEVGLGCGLGGWAESGLAWASIFRVLSC